MPDRVVARGSSNHAWPCSTVVQHVLKTQVKLTNVNHTSNS